MNNSYSLYSSAKLDMGVVRNKVDILPSVGISDNDRYWYSLDNCIYIYNEINSSWSVKYPVNGLKFLLETDGKFYICYNGKFKILGEGSGSSTKEYTVNGSVNIGQVVFLTDSNTVSVADANNISHANRVVGISLETKLNGEIVLIQNDGVVELSSLIPSGVYYVGNAGTITTNPSGLTGFIQKIGIAEDSTHLRIMLGNVIEL